GGQAYLARPRWIGDRRRLRAEGGRGHQGGGGQDEGGGRGDTAGSVGHGDHSLSGRDRSAGPVDRIPVSRGTRALWCYRTSWENATETSPSQHAPTQRALSGSWVFPVP